MFSCVTAISGCAAANSFITSSSPGELGLAGEGVPVVDRRLLGEYLVRQQCRSRQHAAAQLQDRSSIELGRHLSLLQ
jgi:hypothetical protein